MNEFKPTKILSAREAIAEQLRQRRQEKNLRIEDITKELNIKCEYLEALEKGEYNKLPAGIYGKNFLEEYAIFLGLKHKELMKDYQTEENITLTEKNKHIFSQPITKKRDFLIFPKIIKNSIIIIIAFVCLFYLGFCLKKIISPPMLEIMEPKNNLSTNNNFVIVSGKTESEAEVSINGEIISLKENGGESFFDEKINLKTGLNVITITAKKKYGREIKIERQILASE